MRVISFIRDLVSDVVFYLRHRLLAGTLYTELVDFVGESSSEIKVRASWPVCGTIIPIHLDRVIGLHNDQPVSELIRQGYSPVLNVKKSWYLSRIRLYLYLIPPVRVTPEELELALTFARKSIKENP